MFFLHKIKDSVDVPVVANGDIKNEDDVAKVKQMTGVDGDFWVFFFFFSLCVKSSIASCAKTEKQKEIISKCFSKLYNF